eukprot:scaffold2750_cov114-Skeletonema_dohrnii-CCMP3373.AAC.4
MKEMYLERRKTTPVSKACMSKDTPKDPERIPALGDKDRKKCTGGGSKSCPQYQGFDDQPTGHTSHLNNLPYKK